MGKQHGYSDIRVGDRVTYQAYAGMGRNGAEYKPNTGRAVMRGPAGWVLNIGGKHGKTAICDRNNFVSVRKAKGSK